MIEGGPEFSDYIVFVDESGSPTLSPMDPEYPIFALAFCIVRKSTYANVIQPEATRLKFEFFGHELVNLHSSDIRRAKGVFKILQNTAVRERFMAKISYLMDMADFFTFARIVDKRLIVDPSHWFLGSYQVAFNLGLARVALYLDEKGEQDRVVHVVAESRGQREDKELSDHFNLMAPDHLINGIPRFDLRIVPKTINSIGLQLADLCAYPIGRHYLNPDRQNRAFEIIRDKIHVGTFP